MGVLHKRRDVLRRVQQNGGALKRLSDAVYRREAVMDNGGLFRKNPRALRHLREVASSDGNLITRVIDPASISILDKHFGPRASWPWSRPITSETAVQIGSLASG